jgi:hypothetical protein
LAKKVFANIGLDRPAKSVVFASYSGVWRLWRAHRRKVRALRQISIGNWLILQSDPGKTISWR